MGKCSELIADWLFKCEVIEEADKELYSYAFFTFGLSLMPVALALCLGIVLQNIIQSIILVLPIIMIRKYSGGYHAKNLRSCLVISSLLLLFSIEVLKHGILGEGFIILATIAVIFLIIFSPIDNGAKPLSKRECILYKKKTTLYSVAMLLIGFCLSAFELHEYASGIFAGIVLSACLQIPCDLIIVLKMTKKAAISSFRAKEVEKHD